MGLGRRVDLSKSGRLLSAIFLLPQFLPVELSVPIDPSGRETLPNELCKVRALVTYKRGECSENIGNYLAMLAAEVSLLYLPRKQPCARFVAVFIYRYALCLFTYPLVGSDNMHGSRCQGCIFLSLWFLICTLFLGRRQYVHGKELNKASPLPRLPRSSRSANPFLPPERPGSGVSPGRVAMARKPGGLLEALYRSRSGGMGLVCLVQSVYRFARMKLRPWCAA